MTRRLMEIRRWKNTGRIKSNALLAGKMSKDEKREKIFILHRTLRVCDADQPDPADICSRVRGDLVGAQFYKVQPASGPGVYPV